MTLLWHRIGAVSYILWALLHLYVPYLILTETAADLEPGLVRGRVEQTAVFMAQIALLTIVSATWLNWRGSTLGYWITLFLVSWADGFWVILLVIPGHEPLADAWPGLVTWFGGAAFTTIGMLASSRGGHSRVASFGA